MRLTFKHGAAVLLTCAAIYLAAFLLTGYDPIATFASAWRNQHALLAQHARERPYPQTIAWDLLDFALGCGWIGVVLLAFYLAGTIRNGRGAASGAWQEPNFRLVVLVLAQLVVVAVTGLLQAETARVWNFLLPLLCLPIGLELRTWRRGPRVIAYAAMLVILAVVFQNMKFVE